MYKYLAPSTLKAKSLLPCSQFSLFRVDPYWQTRQNGFGQNWIPWDSIYPHNVRDFFYNRSSLSSVVFWEFRRMCWQLKALLMEKMMQNYVSGKTFFVIIQLTPSHQFTSLLNWWMSRPMTQKGILVSTPNPIVPITTAADATLKYFFLLFFHDIKA